LAAVAALHKDFLAAGCDILAVSTDSVLAHKVFHQVSPSARQVAYPLLADQGGEIARAYGVLSPQGVSRRASFLLDPGGVIRYYAVYPDEVGREISEILRVLHGLQSFSLTDAMPPAGWRPGMAGIKADIALAGQI
jgi:alkyl hydroperoxide reductase subunit AhpC